MALKYSVLLVCVLLAVSQLAECKKHKKRQHKQRLLPHPNLGLYAIGEIDNANKIFGGVLDNSQAAIGGGINIGHQLTGGAVNLIHEVIGEIADTVQSATSNLFVEIKKLASSFENGAVKTVAEAVNIIKDLAKKGEALLQNHLGDLQKLVKTIVENAKSTIQNKTDLLKTELQKRADELGEAYKVCVAPKSEELRQLSEKTLENIVASLTNQYEETAKTVGSSVELLKESMRAIQDIDSKTESVLTAIETLKPIALHIAVIVKEASDFSVSVQADLIAGATRNIARFTVDGGKIVDSIATCINNQ